MSPPRFNALKVSVICRNERSHRSSEITSLSGAGLFVGLEGRFGVVEDELAAVKVGLKIARLSVIDKSNNGFELRIFA